MGNLISTRSLFFIFNLGSLLLALMGCAKNLPVNLRSRPQPEMKASYLSGTLTTAEGSALQLETLGAKPSVLIFSQDTCVVCRGEARHIGEWIRSQGMPTKIELITVLIATIIEDVQDFKASLDISWNVAFERNDLTFRRFCPQRKVPCVVIQRPGQGVVLAHEGKMRIEEIMTYSGEWK